MSPEKSSALNIELRSSRNPVYVREGASDSEQGYLLKNDKEPNPAVVFCSNRLTERPERSVNMCAC